MLKPTKRSGWYAVDRSVIAADLIGQIPGVKQVGAAFELHRTHLPLLLSDPQAARALIPPKPDHAARDARMVKLGITLRATQHTALDYIAPRRGVLLGDDMRLGKTLTCVAAHDPASGPFVVICPAMVRPVWISWLSRVFPDEPIGVLKGRKFNHKLLQRRLVVGHYEIMQHWQSAMPIGTLVFDEAHALTNRKSKRSAAAAFLALRAQRVICATGTPIWNMPSDLWQVLSLLEPEAFGSYYAFSDRYAAPEPSAYGTKYTGISNELELQARIAEIMIRRRWMDVVEDLPPIVRSVELVELDVPTLRRLDVLAYDIKSRKGPLIGLLASYRKQLAKVKARAIVAKAQTILARGEPVVVWTWHVEVAQQIAEALGDAAFLLTGEVSNVKRDDRIAAWRGLPAAALVCTMSVAQVGLDFSHARLAVFGEIDYTPAIIAQAEMRTFAPTRSMDVTYIVADHTVDQRMVLALVRKLGASNPLGVAAADDAIESLRLALQGPVEEPDLDRLLAGLLEA